MVLRETREKVRQFRTDVDKALYTVNDSARSISNAGHAISRASLLVGTVAVAALGVALFTLYLLLNRTENN